MSRYLDWMAQAKRDLGRAHIDLKYEYWEWACFTSQQAAEKAVEALLMSRGYSVWGHSVTAMLRRLAEEIEVPADLIARAQLLDTFYIPSRYPNGFPEGKPADYYGHEHAEEAIRAATEIIEFCEGLLPRPE